MCYDMHPQAPSEVLCYGIQTAAVLNHSGRGPFVVVGCRAFVPLANAQRCETMGNVEQSNALLRSHFSLSSQVNELGVRALTRRRSVVRNHQRPLRKRRSPPPTQARNGSWRSGGRARRCSRSEERLAASHVIRGTYRAIEAERLVQFGLALGAAAGLDHLLRGPQAQSCLPGRAAACGPHLRGAHEVTIEAGESGIPPPA